MECTYPPLVEIGENLEFHDLMREWIRVIGLGVYFGTAGFLYFLEFIEILLVQSLLLRVLVICLRVLLGPTLHGCSLSGVFLMVDDAALRLLDNPNVWTDGRLVLVKVSGASSSGAGFYAIFRARVGVITSGATLMMNSTGRIINSCAGYCSVPGPLQTVRRAELWKVVLTLQASDALTWGVVDLNVIRHVGRVYVLVSW